MSSIPVPDGDLSTERMRELRVIEVAVLADAADDIGRWLRPQIVQSVHVRAFEQIAVQWAALFHVLALGEWHTLPPSDPPEWLAASPADDPAATPQEAQINWYVGAVREVARQVAQVAGNHPCVIQAIVQLEQSYEDLLGSVIAGRSHGIR